MTDADAIDFSAIKVGDRVELRTGVWELEKPGAASPGTKARHAWLAAADYAAACTDEIKPQFQCGNNRDMSFYLERIR